jgi:non-ribosomal peptide synthetase component F
MNKFFLFFFENLGRQKDLPALTGTSCRTFSYKELNEQVASYAETLGKLNGEKKRVVAILSSRNTYNIALILAIIKCGSAYLPIEPSNPVKRILDYLHGVDPFALLVENKVLHTLKLNEHLTVSAEHPLDNNYTLLILNETAVCIYEDAVQLLYTSGSTGKPKAVVHTYESISWFIKWSVHTFQHAAGTNVLAIAPTSFDLSVFDLFFSLSTQSNLVIPSNEELVNIRQLALVISRFKIDLIYATPSFFKLLVENHKLATHHYPDVKYVLLAGEQLTWHLVHHLKVIFNNATFFNLYGPTESNVCCYYQVDFNDEGNFPVNVPIGQACKGISIALGSAQDTLHELTISGPSLFKGYIIDHILSVAGDSYSSGDLVQLHHDKLIFVKRGDRMIKRNGYRIEPYEIEQCISQLPDIEQVLVTEVKRDKKSTLVAYVQTQVPYSKLHIKNHCLEHLPHYFLPDSIVVTNNMPLNTNFKPDLTKLT